MNKDEIPVTREGLEIYVRELKKVIKPLAEQLQESERRLLLMPKPRVKQ